MGATDSVSPVEGTITSDGAPYNFKWFSQQYPLNIFDTDDEMYDRGKWQNFMTKQGTVSYIGHKIVQKYLKEKSQGKNELFYQFYDHSNTLGIYNIQHLESEIKKYIVPNIVQLHDIKFYFGGRPFNLPYTDNTHIYVYVQWVLPMPEVAPVPVPTDDFYDNIIKITQEGNIKREENLDELIRKIVNENIRQDIRQAAQYGINTMTRQENFKPYLVENNYSQRLPLIENTIKKYIEKDLSPKFAVDVKFNYNTNLTHIHVSWGKIQ